MDNQTLNSSPSQPLLSQWIKPEINVLSVSKDTLGAGTHGDDTGSFSATS